MTPKLNVTPGIKLAAYTINVLHYADDGSTVGELTCYPNLTAACPATLSNSGSFTAWLPSLDANYRLLPNLSVYAQGTRGSIVPPSAVYDYNQTAASANAALPQLQTAPKQQMSTTYQIGSVYKGQKFTFDADAYRIRFQNSYSSTLDTITTDPDYGDTIYYLNPSSVTKGIEFENHHRAHAGPEPVSEWIRRQRFLLRLIECQRVRIHSVLRAGALQPVGGTSADRYRNRGPDVYAPGIRGGHDQQAHRQ